MDNAFVTASAAFANFAIAIAQLNAFDTSDRLFQSIFYSQFSDRYGVLVVAILANIANA